MKGNATTGGGWSSSSSSSSSSNAGGAGAITVDQLIGQAFVKAASIVLGDRIASSGSPEPGSEGTKDALGRGDMGRKQGGKPPKGSWFKLHIEERDEVNEMIGLWKRKCKGKMQRSAANNLCAPLVLDVYLKPGSGNAFKGKTDVSGAIETKNPEKFASQSDPNGMKLLERWTVQYVASSQSSQILSGSLSRSGVLRFHPRAVYKKLSLLLRALYSYLRILPAHKLKRAAASNGEDVFSFVFAMHSETGGLQKEGMKTYSFHPVETASGEFVLQVDYKTDIVTKYMAKAGQADATTKKKARDKMLVSPVQQSPRAGSLTSSRKPWSSRLAGMRAFSQRKYGEPSSSAPSAFVVGRLATEGTKNMNKTEDDDSKPQGRNLKEENVSEMMEESGRISSSPMEIPGSQHKQGSERWRGFNPQTVSGRDSPFVGLSRGSSLPIQIPIVGEDGRGRTSFDSPSSGGSSNYMTKIPLRAGSETSDPSPRYGAAFSPGDSPLSSTRSYPAVVNSPELPFAFTPTSNHMETFARTTSPRTRTDSSEGMAYSIPGREISTSLALHRKESSSTRSYQLSEGFHSMGYSISPLHDPFMNKEFSLPETPSYLGHKSYLQMLSPHSVSNKPLRLLEGCSYNDAENQKGTSKETTSPSLLESRDDLPFAFADDITNEDLEPLVVTSPKENLGMQLGYFSQLMREPIGEAVVLKLSEAREILEASKEWQNIQENI
eukprot:jgi/Picsp_1/564/NSC_00561-R1_---NA---